MIRFRLQGIASSCLFVFLMFLSADCLAIASDWQGGDGDWFDLANWDAGVPNENRSATINNGGIARFDQLAIAGAPAPVFPPDPDADIGTFPFGLQVGGSLFSNPGPITEGEVNGSASLHVFGAGRIGRSGSTGINDVNRRTGRVFLNGGDLVSFGVFDEGLSEAIGGFDIGIAGGTGTNTSYTGIGQVEIINGSLRSEGPIDVGEASGTGSGSRTAEGSVSILNGNLLAELRVNVGTAGGTGQPVTLAEGFTRIVGGDLIITPVVPDIFTDLPPISTLNVGTVRVVSRVRGTANGELIVEQGDIESQEVNVGVLNNRSDQTATADGTLILRSGDLRMERMQVGVITLGQGTLDGLFHLSDGVVSGDSLVVGENGEIILEIGSSLAVSSAQAVASSTLPAVPTPYGRLEVDQVQFDGTLEVRFTGDFSTAPGTTYELISSSSLSGDFDLIVTGLRTADADRLTILQSANGLQLQFPIPEPDTALLVGLLLPMLVFSYRRPFA